MKVTRHEKIMLAMANDPDAVASKMEEMESLLLNMARLTVRVTKREKNLKIH